MDTPTPSDSPPALWNPNAAACWSLLFSPAFGAFLDARNAETLGRSAEAKANWVWFYASLVFAGFALLSVFVPRIPDAVLHGGSIGILVGWYVSLGTKQIQLVKASWKDEYQRKGWTKPLLIACACLVAFFAVVSVLGIIVGALGLE